MAEEELNELDGEEEGGEEDDDEPSADEVAQMLDDAEAFVRAAVEKLEHLSEHKKIPAALQEQGDAFWNALLDEMAKH